MNDNNFVSQQPQQPQQPQQQFQQNGNQQQYQQQYQQAQYPKKSINEIFRSLLPKLALAFLLIACVAIAYHVINGIVQAAKYSKDYDEMLKKIDLEKILEVSKSKTSGFGIFVDHFILAISAGAKYLFYAIVTVGVNKVVNK